MTLVLVSYFKLYGTFHNIRNNNLNSFILFQYIYNYYTNTRVEYTIYIMSESIQI
jgi:hypothetical protein